MAGSFNQRDEKGNIIYPYLAEGRIYEYVPSTNPFMATALDAVAKMEREHPEVNRATAATVVKEGKIIGQGTNGSVHKTFCPRVALSSLSGEEYQYCPNNCHESNHAEPTAIKNAVQNGHDPNGADLYLAGHWWACKPCWDAMIAAGINHVYLVEDAHDLYDELKRRQSGQKAGLLKNPISAFVSGHDKDLFISWLEKVNFSPADTHDVADIIVLLPGAEPIDASTKPIYDYQDQADLKLVLTQLSENIQSLI